VAPAPPVQDRPIPPPPVRPPEPPPEPSLPFRLSPRDLACISDRGIYGYFNFENLEDRERAVTLARRRGDVEMLRCVAAMEMRHNPQGIRIVATYPDPYAEPGDAPVDIHFGAYQAAPYAERRLIYLHPKVEQPAFFMEGLHLILTNYRVPPTEIYLAEPFEVQLADFGQQENQALIADFFDHVRPVYLERAESYPHYMDRLKVLDRIVALLRSGGSAEAIDAEAKLVHVAPGDVLWDEPGAAFEEIVTSYDFNEASGPAIGAVSGHMQEADRSIEERRVFQDSERLWQYDRLVEILTRSEPGGRQ